MAISLPYLLEYKSLPIRSRSRLKDAPSNQYFRRFDSVSDIWNKQTDFDELFLVDSDEEK